MHRIDWAWHTLIPVNSKVYSNSISGVRGLLPYWGQTRCVTILGLFLANFPKRVEKFIRSFWSQLNLQFSSKLGYLASVCLNLPSENDFRLNQVIFYNNFSFEVHTITCFRLATLPTEEMSRRQGFENVLKWKMKPSVHYQQNFGTGWRQRDLGAPPCKLLVSVWLKFSGGQGWWRPSKHPPPYEQLLPLLTPCFKMFLERSLNDPHPRFKHLSLLPPPHPPPLPP